MATGSSDELMRVQSGAMAWSYSMHVHLSSCRSRDLPAVMARARCPWHHLAALQQRWVLPVGMRGHWLGYRTVHCAMAMALALALAGIGATTIWVWPNQDTESSLAQTSCVVLTTSQAGQLLPGNALWIALNGCTLRLGGLGSRWCVCQSTAGKATRKLPLSRPANAGPRIRHGA